MTVETFITNFAHLADAPNGVRKLRELILQLAVQGKLVSQDPEDEPASVLLERIGAEKERLIKEGEIKKGRTLPELDCEPYCLPDGWQWARLNDVYDVRDGTHDSPRYVLTGFPMVTSKNLSSGRLDLSDVKFISEADHLKIQDRSKVDKFDILFAMIGSIGNPVIVDIETDFSIKNVALFKYYSLDHSEPKYLFQYLVNVSNEMRMKSAGGVQSFVSLGFLRGYPFPLPPLAEQHRIVAKVDQLMALCDELEARQQKQLQGRTRFNNAALEALLTVREPDEFAAHWQRISTNFDLLYDHPETIGKLRAAILQLAVQGRLVPQDSEDEPASVLLERIKAEKVRLVKEGVIRPSKAFPAISLDEIFGQIPKGWKWVRLGELGETQTGTTPSRNDKDNVGSHIPFIGPGDIKSHVIDYSGEGLSEKGLSLGRLIRNGSVLMVCIGGSIGKCAINDRAISCNQQINAITPYLMDSLRFIFLAMRADWFQGPVIADATGSATPIINKQKWSSIPIPVPPASEQKRIVAKVDRLMALCDALEAKLNQARQQSEKLMEASVQQLLVG